MNESFNKLRVDATEKLEASKKQTENRLNQLYACRVYVQYNTVSYYNLICKFIINILLTYIRLNSSP